MDCVLLVPVKAFADAKARLAPVLSPQQREALARWSAERVLRAANHMPTAVVCDHPSVAEWATANGARVLWHPGVGLNAAITLAFADLRSLGADHVVIAHGDLPRAAHLHRLPARRTITLVPDARLDGTNVLSLPTAVPFNFQYGLGSFRRHLDEALALSGQHCTATSVRHDPLLSIDIDNPLDLTHPLVQEVLPPWLLTNPVNPSPPSN